MLPLTVLTLLVVCAIFAPLITTYDPTSGVLTERNLPPAWSNGGSFSHLLGTDPVGRDVLTRVIYGARISLMVGIGASLMSRNTR